MKVSKMIAFMGLGCVIFIMGGILGAVTYREFGPPKIIYEKGSAPVVEKPREYKISENSVLSDELTSAMTFSSGHPLTYVSDDKIITDNTIKANTLFTGYKYSKEKFNIFKDIKSRYTMLVFSDVMCPHCRHNTEMLRKVRSRFSDKDLEIVIVNPPIGNLQMAEMKTKEFEKKLKEMTEEERKSFLEDDFTRFRFATLNSESELMNIAQMFEVESIPLTFLIKNKGIVPKVILRYEGPLILNADEKIEGLEQKETEERALQIKKALDKI